VTSNATITTATISWILEERSAAPSLILHYHHCAKRPSATLVICHLSHARREQPFRTSSILEILEETTPLSSSLVQFEEIIDQPSALSLRYSKRPLHYLHLPTRSIRRDHRSIISTLVEIVEETTPLSSSLHSLNLKRSIIKHQHSR